MRILLAGGTGLVGGKVMAGLLEQGHHVLSVGRRASGVVHPHLADLLADFAALPALAAADVAVCALGTTIAAAGSRDAFRAVDHGATLSFLKAAHEAGTTRAIVVTAVGANPGARAFYSRVKGEVERDAGAIGFTRLDIIRPGLILGARAERRPLESLMQSLAPLVNPLLVGHSSQLGAIASDTIAEAIVLLSARREAGHHIHGNREMRQLVLQSR